MRYEAFEVDPDLGIEVGVFGLVNRLARRGLLNPEEESIRKTRNALFESAFTDPATVDSSVYDRSMNPRTKAWFKEATAQHLLSQIDGHLRILDAHGVDCRRSVAHITPGRLIYEDDVQVVVVPH